MTRTFGWISVFRKFDIATGETWSVYFRVVNTKTHKVSPYYIVDLSCADHP